VEVVERKGLGHPDTMCDALAEEVSMALSRFYVDRFGFVLHHNVDKVLLRGGAARPAFGGGVVDEPIEIYLAGRATRTYRGVEIPVEQLTIDSCRSWLSANMHALDVDRHVRVHCLVRPGSVELVELFERQRREGTPRLANDTSIGVGYAPLTALERTVIVAERSVRATDAPERGEDVKVMGVRETNHARLTVACAFIGSTLTSLEDYFSAKDRAAASVRTATASAFGSTLDVEVNTADDPGAGSVYLTVTGTSAEAGDDGQTGRGNRANGLITPARPMTIESFAGKNAVTHVGKLYNVAATRIAEDLVAQVDGVREAQVVLVSRIGTPIERPPIVYLRLRGAAPGVVASRAPHAKELARAHLADIGRLWQSLLTTNLATA
jgi:S-adenosylmethionine synthetase